jgi:hypothetical protein
MTDTASGPAHAQALGTAFQRGLSPGNARFLEAAMSGRNYRKQGDIQEGHELPKATKLEWQAVRGQSTTA